MGEVNWVSALGSLDWTVIIVSLIGGGGLLGVIVQNHTLRRRKSRDRAAEDRAAETVSTPATGAAVHDVEAFRMAQQAMRIADSAREENKTMKTRMKAVETELSLFRGSYKALYEWAQRKIIGNWETVRLQDSPPALPADIHHPDA